MAVRNDIWVDYSVSPRVIWVDAPSTELIVQDLIDTIWDIQARVEAMSYTNLLLSAGKEQLDEQTKVGLTVTLNNAQIAFEDRLPPDWILCSIKGGNIVAVEDVKANPLVYIDARKPTAYVSVDRTSSASATLSELEAIQHSSFGGSVHYDATSIYSGTDFPKGTPQEKVNNWADAISIANTRGFTKFSVYGNANIGAGVSLVNKIVFGQSSNLSAITVDAAADVTNCEFQECTLSGTLDGGCIIRNSSLGNLSYVNGVVYNCMLSGTVTLGGGAEAHFFDCKSGVIGESTPTIDMGGSGQSLALRGYAGGIEIINKTGAESVNLSLVSGQIKIGADVTGGTVICRGIGNITENLGSATILNRLIESETAQAVAKLLGNNVSKSGDVITIYEDDGITIWKQYNLADGGRVLV